MKTTSDKIEQTKKQRDFDKIEQTKKKISDIRKQKRVEVNKASKFVKCLNDNTK